MTKFCQLPEVTGFLKINECFPKKTGKKESMNPKKIQSNRFEMPKLLHQLDLSAGYHAIHRIDTFSQPLVDHYRSSLPNGGLIHIFEGQFWVSIRGPRFCLFHEDLPILEGGIGIGRDSTWDELHGVIKDLNWTLEAKPHDGFWVAEIPLESMYKLGEEPINWVFDFVRHLAAAMIGSDTNRPV